VPCRARLPVLRFAAPTWHFGIESASAKEGLGSKKVPLMS